MLISSICSISEIETFFDCFFRYMIIPEIREIAIHQMYRKCREDIGDGRQYGEYWGKRKAMAWKPLPFNSYLLSYSAEIPASFTFTSEYPTEREKWVYGFEKLQPLHTIFTQNSLYVFNFYRLCQVSIHSCCQTLFFIFSECICCHGNNRDCLSIWMFQ